MYVVPAHHGHGVGPRLLQALVEQAEAAGIWTVQTGVLPDNGAGNAPGARIVNVKVGAAEGAVDVTQVIAAVVSAVTAAAVLRVGARIFLGLGPRPADDRDERTTGDVEDPDREGAPVRTRAANLVLVVPVLLLLGGGLVVGLLPAVRDWAATAGEAFVSPAGYSRAALSGQVGALGLGSPAASPRAAVGSTGGGVVSGVLGAVLALGLGLGLAMVYAPQLAELARTRLPLPLVGAGRQSAPRRPGSGRGVAPVALRADRGRRELVAGRGGGDRRPAGAARLR